jgi:hypothetical protein
VATQRSTVDHPLAPAGYGFGSGADDVLQPWSHVLRRLEVARNFWLATVRPDGRPQVTPVWGLWLDGAIYFSGLPAARWARNVAERPAAEVHLESGDDVVILEGKVVHCITDADLSDRIVSAWTDKYGRFAPEAATRGVYRFDPRVVRAWRDWSLRDGTRWRLSERDGA